MKEKHLTISSSRKVGNSGKSQSRCPDGRGFVLEVCCGNIASVRAAVEGGADRIELCRDLELDGLTPSREMIREAVGICHPVGVKVHVLIRCRAGNFVYTQEEAVQMADEIRVAISEGADGIVIGALTPEGDIDVGTCRQWIDAIKERYKQERRSYSLLVTFHRAFDVCRNPFSALDEIIHLGCNRLLTSGQAPTAEEGIPMIKMLVEYASSHPLQDGACLKILCGSGVNTTNAAHIFRETGATEIHGSLRTGTVTDPEKVRKVKKELLISCRNR